MRADFASQAYFRNPAAEIEKLRASGPVVEVRFPLVGKVWTTTTQDLADRVLKDSETFTIRSGMGGVAGLQWWMPRIVRTLANHMLSKDEPDHRRLRDIVDEAFRASSRLPTNLPASCSRQAAPPIWSTAMRGRCRSR
jgi:cytochrome P450 PksS